MSGKMFSVSSVTENPRIVIHSSPSLPLAREIKKQLSSYSYLQVEIAQSFSNLSPTEDLDVAIYCPQADARPDALATFLSQIKMFHPKVYLVFSAHAGKQNLDPKTISVFKQEMNLDCDVIYNDEQTTLTQAAADIISKFIYGHSPPPEKEALKEPEAKFILLPKDDEYTRYTSSLTPAPPARGERKVSKYLFILLAPVLFWLLTIIQIATLSALTLCTYKSFSAGRLTLSSYCNQAGRGLVSAIYYQLPVNIGSSKVLRYFGYSPELLLQSYYSFSDAWGALIELQKTSGNILQQMQTPGFSFSELEKLPGQLNAASEALALLQSHLRDLYLVSPQQSGVLVTWATRLNTVQQALFEMQSILPDLSYLLGEDRPINYALIVQDHHEIRPTGGYFDTVVLFAIDRGQIKDVQFKSTLASENLFYGQVEPPVSFKSATGTSQWQIGDSNWDPDFPTSARRIAWFLEKQYSYIPDVILSYNTSSFPSLLRILGPLVSGDQVRITSTNFEKYYIPMQMQKDTLSQSFLQQLLQPAYAQLQKMSENSYRQLSMFIMQQFHSHQSALYSITKPLPEFDRIGWSGGLPNLQCRAENCLDDLFYFVDSNISHSKLDTYISRSSNLKIDFSENDGGIKYLYEITYSNHAPKELFNSTVYKNFLRIYLPPHISLDTLKINDTDLPPDKLTVSSEHSLTLVSFSIEVPVGESTHVQFSAKRSGHRPPLYYSLSLPLQSGVTEYLRQIEINFPPQWSVTAFQIPSVASRSSLRYNTPTNLPPAIQLNFQENTQ